VSDARGRPVVLVIGSSSLGGAERQALLLAGELKSGHGLDVVVVAMNRRKGRAAALCETLGVPLVRVDFRSAGNKTLMLLNLPLLALRLRTLRPRALVCYTAVPNIFCALVWRLTGAAQMIWNQRDEGRDLSAYPYARAALRVVTRIVSNSEGGRRALQGFGADMEAISVIRNGLAMDPPAIGRGAWRSAHGVPDSAVAVIMVANLSANKDHATLLEAWALFRAGGVPASRNGVLLLAGRLDACYSELSRKAAALCLGESIRFLGELTDVRSALGACDVQVHSSRSEGCPNAVLEGLAAGIPVVASEIPAIRDLLSHSLRIETAAPGDARGLAEKLLQVTGDLETHRGEAAGNVSAARALFGVESMAAHYARLLAARSTEEGAAG
jgi:glycosyltransferase involved in cell wall biosynthesis